MGYLANSVCFKTDLEAAQSMCSSWHSTHMSSNYSGMEYCYKAYTPSAGVAGLTIVFRNISATGTYVDSYQGPWITLMPCNFVDSNNTFKATSEDYQAVTIVFSSVLVALCMVWGFRQIMRIFSTHPEA